jgi:hypothetical protein
MVSAIASSSAAGAGGNVTPADGQATLARLQHQLSDNVNCASAKTPEGKATISAIEDKIKTLKESMDGKPAAAAGATAAPAAGGATATVPSATSGAVSASGGVIDTYA